jgi:rhodanese-related sulfurtransferase/DNA-binding transcriptional ArsR family regulator
MITDTRIFKTELYEQLARIGKAVASPHRLELLELLAQGERRVDDLAAESGLSMANASQHLQALRRAHLVESRREGTAIFYRLASDDVARLLLAIRATAERQLAELDQLARTWLSDRDAFDALDAESLWERMERDEVTVIDVRPMLEYRAGHLPGARSMPIDELEERLDELPRGQQVVAYCRGPYCVFADRAVAMLREHGFEATRLDDGLPEWRLAGLPVEQPT